MFESYLAMYAHADTLVGVAISDAQLLPIFIINFLDGLYNQSI